MVLGVVNSISQACGKLSFNIWHYLHTPKEGRILRRMIEEMNGCSVSATMFPYHNLRNLSRLFKDNLANRLLCKLLEGTGIPHEFPPIIFI